MTKKLIIFIILISLLIAGGVFWWWQRGEKIKSSLEPLEYIVVRETPEGKFVENKKEGLSVKVPEGWKVQKPTNEQEPISFYSSFKKDACKIEMSISDKVRSIEEIKESVNKTIQELYTIEESEFSILEIKGYQALKHVFQAVEMSNILSITIYIPTSTKVYNFELFVPLQYKEKCYHELEVLIESTTFK